MWLFVGLGNPGDKYRHNRHNIGFMAADEIARRHNFSGWEKKFQGLVCEGRLGGERVLLLKPQTYMNLSGQSVQAAAAFYKIPPGDIVVFHDELDLAPGKVRVKKGGGSGGHNGIKSIDEHLGPEYWRVRLGIGHPGDRNLVSPYVLSDFFRADREWLEPLIDAVGGNAALLCERKGELFMTKAAQAMPAREEKGTTDECR
jgi:PTH1 family peptidyl-tRNA hydrolase